MIKTFLRSLLGKEGSVMCFYSWWTLIAIIFFIFFLKDGIIEYIDLKEFQKTYNTDEIHKIISNPN